MGAFPGMTGLAAVEVARSQGALLTALRQSLSPRMLDLMRAASAALDDGRDPFAAPFLSEHGVTIDEAYALANLTSLALDMVTTTKERGTR